MSMVWEQTWICPTIRIAWRIGCPASQEDGWQYLRFIVQEGCVSDERRVIDTNISILTDVSEAGRGDQLRSLTCQMRSRSLVVLRRQQ
jgi:hypothetical protein